MRYHVVVFLVPHPYADSTEEIPLVDEEFDFPESQHKVIDEFNRAIDQLKAEGGTSGDAQAR
jgi:hypothetical protein